MQLSKIWTLLMIISVGIFLLERVVLVYDILRWLVTGCYFGTVWTKLVLK